MQFSHNILVYLYFARQLFHRITTVQGYIEYAELCGMLQPQASIFCQPLPRLPYICSGKRCKPCSRDMPGVRRYKILPQFILLVSSRQLCQQQPDWIESQWLAHQSITEQG